MVKKKTRKFIELAAILANEFKDLAPHTPIPTVIAIKERFKISLSTAKRTILELQKNNIIYSRVGCGSFIAPKSKRRTILIISELDVSLKQHDFVSMRFLSSALIQCNRHYPDFSVSALDFAQLKEKINSLDILYPGLCGIVFMRRPESMREYGPILDKMGIKVAFYGSSSYFPDYGNFCRLVYDEKSIVDLALDALIKDGRKNIGIVYTSDFIVYNARVKFFTSYLNKLKLLKRKLVFETSQQRIESLSRDEIRQRLLGCDALVCTNDQLADAVIQRAIDVGFKVPEEIAVIGVNNEILSEYRQPSITSVGFDIEEDARRTIDLLIKYINEDEKYYENSQLTLVRRESF